MQFTSTYAGKSEVEKSFGSKYLGKSEVLQSMSTKRLGRSRIRNDSLIGYVVRVGEDALPSLNGDPTAEGTSLPISISITPPVSGTKVLNVLVRKRNAYGLESANQRVQTFTIDSSGDLVDLPVAAPDAILAVILPNGKIRVGGTYSRYDADMYPATAFRIWIGTSAPDVGVDLFAVEQAIPGNSFGYTLEGPYSTGTYHIAVCLYREGDLKQSDPVRTTVTIASVSAPSFT